MTDMQGLHILIVDDNPSLLLLLSETFRLEGCRVSSAQDGTQAMAAARQLRPDALVLDVGLPGRNGFEVCRALRADPETASLPIILLTARAAEGDRHWGLDAGADEYLTKPFDPKRLVETASELLASRRTGAARNPLTKLPHLQALARELHARRQRGEGLALRVLEFEPESLATLRRKYGDPVCGKAVRAAASCLESAVGGEPQARLAHAGDASYSRFAVIAPRHLIDGLLARALPRCAAAIRELYDATDRRRDGVLVRQPGGGEQLVPLLCLQATACNDLEAELDSAA